MDNLAEEQVHLLNSLKKPFDLFHTYMCVCMYSSRRTSTPSQFTEEPIWSLIYIKHWKRIKQKEVKTIGTPKGRTPRSFEDILSSPRNYARNPHHGYSWQWCHKLSLAETDKHILIKLVNLQEIENSTIIYIFRLYLWK